MNTDPIEIEQTFSASVSEVWKAITEKDRMCQWFFQPLTEFQPVEGFQTEFDVEFEGRTFRHQWKVTEVVPEVRLTYDWKYEGHRGESTVTWELSETSEGTKLSICHSGQETFSEDEPAFSRENGVAGWTFLIQQSLKDFLEQST